MIFPITVYSKIFLREARSAKPQTTQKYFRSAVSGHVVCHDAVQTRFAKSIGNDVHTEHFHKPLTLLWKRNGITHKTRLEGASYNISQ